MGAQAAAFPARPATADDDGEDRLILSMSLLLALVTSGFVWVLHLGEAAPALQAVSTLF